MEMKREFDEAIALGESNQSILELARNFCDHLQVEALARGGLEAAMNLPIGMRMFDCEYASGHRIGAMDLRQVALTFYDHNCNGCEKRKPKGFPNLLDLVRDRDEELARRATDQERRGLAEKRTLEARDEARSRLRIGMPATSAGLLDLIGRLDHENSEATAQLLTETARTVPEQFTDPLREALKQIAAADGEHRRTGALRALKAIGIEGTEIVALALNAARRNLACIAAAAILAEGDLQNADAEVVQAALPSLIHAAIPLRDFLEAEPTRPPSVAAALVRIYHFFPGHTGRVLRHLLNDEAKEIRIRAAGAAEIIIREEPEFGVEIAGELIVLDPSRTLSALLEMMENLGNSHAELKSKLIRILGKASKNRDLLPLVLPSLYRAMTDVEVIVRMEAAEAYRHVAAESPNDLPPLVHETFLCMLVDPYIAVHRAGLESLAQVNLPERYRDRAAAIAWQLIRVHRSGSDEATLLAAMEAFCAKSKASPRWSALLPDVVEVARTLSTFNKHSAAQRLAWRLSGIERYADLLVDLLVDPDLGFARGDLLERLRREPLQNVARVARRLNEAAEPDLQVEFRIAQGHDPVDVFTSLLADADAWVQAEGVARRRVAHLNGSRKSAMKRVALGRALAVSFSRAASEGRWSDADRQSALWRTHVGEIEPKERRPFETWFDARIEAYVQLRQSATGQTDRMSLQATAEALAAAAILIGDTRAGAAYRRLGLVLRGLAFLDESLEAVRGATPEAEKFVRAARRAGKDLLADLGKDAENDPMHVTAMMLMNADEDSIAAIAATALTAQIALPLLPRSRFRGAPPIFDKGRVERAEVVVAFTSFRIDGKPVRENEPIEPRLLHEFEIDIVVSQWPESAGHLTLDVTTVELPETFAFSPFVFKRPAEELPRYRLTEQGRILLKEAQTLGPRPLEFQYRARFENTEGLTVSVEGQRTLRLRSYDPEKTPETGAPDADRKLLEVADTARQYPGISDEELGHFLRIMSRTAALAVQALADNKFPGQWTESEFQSKAVEFLRSDPRIGTKLQQHAETAAGETDLTFQEMPVELKVEARGEVTPESVVRFADQAIQYAVGNGRRFAVLAVLDTSPKNEAPVPVSNDISFAPQIRHNGAPIIAPVLLGTVIIRGNLPVPSSHSRQRKATPKKKARRNTRS